MAIKITATNARRIPIHCRRANLSFKMIQARTTVAAGYNELSVADISSRPTLVARAKKILPPVSKIPAKAIMGNRVRTGSSMFRDSIPTINTTNIEALLAETKGHRIAFELT